MKPLGTVGELASNWAGHGAGRARRFAQDPVAKFLANGRVCTGPVCLSSNPAGLTRTREMFAQGFDVCDICANTMSAAELERKNAELKAAKETKREEEQPRMARMGADKKARPEPVRPAMQSLWQQLTQRKGQSQALKQAGKGFRKAVPDAVVHRARKEDVQPRMARIGADKKSAPVPVTVVGYDPARPGVAPVYVATDKDGKATAHVLGPRTGITGTVWKDEFSGFDTPKRESMAVTSRPAETGAQAPGCAEALLPRAAKPQTQPTRVATGESARGAPRTSGVAQRAREETRGGVDLLPVAVRQAGLRLAQDLGRVRARARRGPPERMPPSLVPGLLRRLRRAH